MTKQELSQLYYLNREIAQYKSRLQELESAATGITAKITGMPGGRGVSDKIGNYAAEIADLKQLIKLNMEKCWYELNRLNRYIASIPDSQMRQIMSLRYINGLSWQQVADSLGYEGDGSTERKKVDRFLKVSRFS